MPLFCIFASANKVYGFRKFFSNYLAVRCRAKKMFSVVGILINKVQQTFYEDAYPAG